MKSQQTCSNDLELVDASTVQSIFDVFYIVYGNAWKSQVTNLEYQRKILIPVWLKIIQAMTKADVAEALEYLYSAQNLDYRTFPPTPLQFVDIVKKSRHGELPPPEVAFKAVVDGNNCHPIATYTLGKMDRYALKRMSESDARNLYKKHYKYYTDQYLRGEICFDQYGKLLASDTKKIEGSDTKKIKLAL